MGSVASSRWQLAGVSATEFLRWIARITILAIFSGLSVAVRAGGSVTLRGNVDVDPPLSIFRLDDDDGTTPG